MADPLRIYVSGIGGLIGSTVAEVATAQGHSVSGIDSDERAKFFGPAGSVQWRMAELEAQGISVTRGDFRSNTALVAGADVVVHCASQPSHDFSRSHVLYDSALNYMGTVELLEATRTLAPKAVFVFMSTNKVYGDRVNSLEYRVEDRRFVLGDGFEVFEHGIHEDFDIDQSLHTPFGVSKLAADLMVQEYRRSFGMRTVAFRCGCLTGAGGTGVEMQGFLGYLVKCAVEGKPYTVYGHEGYQVRDNIDARDVADAVLRYAMDPKDGVYVIGGGRDNAISVREAIAYLKSKGFDFEVDFYGHERVGDHKWWVSDSRHFEEDYPGWSRRPVWAVIDDMIEAAVKAKRAA